MGIIIELKYAQFYAGMERACEEAMTQIRELRYDERLQNEDRNDILAYGIAFCKKKHYISNKRKIATYMIPLNMLLGKHICYWSFYGFF